MPFQTKNQNRNIVTHVHTLKCMYTPWHGSQKSSLYGSLLDSGSNGNSYNHIKRYALESMSVRGI